MDETHVRGELEKDLEVACSLKSFIFFSWMSARECLPTFDNLHLCGMILPNLVPCA